MKPSEKIAQTISQSELTLKDQCAVMEVMSRLVRSLLHPEPIDIDKATKDLTPEQTKVVRECWEDYLISSLDIQRNR
ncbi:MAG: hypothetical protein AAF810_05445 [Cyanobacteria bacterium P01_D01_bin.36]